MTQVYSPTALKTYLTEGAATVFGHLQPSCMTVIHSIIEIQQSLEISGNIAEIGVLMGKSFILLALSLKNDEVALAIDRFETPDRPDLARGDFEATFLANVARFVADSSAVRSIKMLSEQITPRQMRRLSGADVRLFSIDGDHARAAVTHDFALARSVLAPAGVIIFDDFLNPLCLGVTEAIYDYFFRNEDRPQGEEAFVPFAVTPLRGSFLQGSGKLFVCRKAVSACYREMLGRIHPRCYVGQLLGHEIACIDFDETLAKRYLLPTDAAP
jgi:predicted O-methyltransferase YrrM